MSPGLDLRIIIDGDCSHLYRQREQVKGRVSLGLNGREGVDGLKVSFIGICATENTRQIHASGNMEEISPRCEYGERIELFRFERILISGCILEARKHSWNFEFVFPECTNPRYSRWTQGSKYMKEPHPLPPSFELQTDIPGGQASISYFIEAKFIRASSSMTNTAIQPLVYQPKTPNTPLDPLLMSRCLYAQIWKLRKESRGVMDKAFNKMSRKSAIDTGSIRIVPTIHFPERVAPRQHIPLYLSLSLGQDSFLGENNQIDCTIDSLTVSISTYTTIMWGKQSNPPEETVAKHVTCISKQDMNQPVLLDMRTKLTHNFRLVDDIECVPSFKTYTITRRYALTTAIGIKCQDRKLTIRSTTSLEILPRIPLSPMNARFLEDDGVPVDPLPLYMPREPSTEQAPDYEALYSLSPTPSTALSLAETRSSSLASGALTPSTVPTTPASELERPALEELDARNSASKWLARARQKVASDARR
ncbi:hypothetical protein CC78DRAFT_110537 [Lojkania enalia]|uniref:Arrestin-like N-terminal domain-containing protein n=1 Tax=Lojkania enalia TaxID=147567 RepID=A0A9P4KFS5_9PLEO|nr:hypothetical protein CC78DRAFT_110537 [Didymosphaeria enalia]